LSSFQEREQHQVSESDLRLDRLASVGQIAAGIAHEVKNPLTAVKGFLQLLKHEAPHKYLDFAYAELENAIDTMQNLLHVSKPDLEDEPFDDIQLCSELEALLYLFQERSYEVSIQKQFSDCDTRIYGKRNQLKKAFFNLLKNAFEATGDNGTITVKHYKSGDKLFVKVSDTGVGIPEGKLKLLGTPFYTSKSEGTGMGLTQVFASVYEHNGIIRVRSEVGAGTEFSIEFPVHHPTSNQWEAIPMNVKYVQNHSFPEFYLTNKPEFLETLKLQGKEIFELIHVSDISPASILESANTVVMLLNERNEQGLIAHAKEHGRNWASHNLDLILKLEWIQMLRKTYWDLLHHYYANVEQTEIEFFQLERQINYTLDTYLKHFASSYAEFKNEVLRNQRVMIEELSVPVIPLYEHTAILPIMGTLDTARIKKIQEHAFDRIYQLKLKEIIIDLSGVAYMDDKIMSQLFKIVNGASIQGCKAIMTGIRPEMTSTMVELGISLHERVETRGSLQQALEECVRSYKL
jgi:anti-anti-sigma regulatory factor